MSVAIDHGYLPSGRYILNHDISHCATDGLMADRLYSGRALCLSEPWDMIQLHPDLKPMWSDIVAHYRRIGLGHSHDVIWHVHPAELGEHIGYHPSVFYFGPQQCCFWGDHGWLETVEFINSKNNFIALAEELGVDVPATLCFDRPGDVSASDLQHVVYPCYAKAAVSVSGAGIYRCENQDQLLEALALLEADVPIQLQEAVDAVSVLNMQYRVVGKDVVRLAASEQILDGFVRRGDRAPARHEPWKSVDPMAEWLMERGIKGLFAFDVAVVQTERGLRFPAIQCNPRFNSASYLTAIAHKLDIPEWSAMTFTTRFRSLADIDLQGIEFDSRTGVGVVIVNWGAVLEGKLLVLLAGTPKQQQLLHLELDARLC
jgi:hypothetical protein